MIQAGGHIFFDVVLSSLYGGFKPDACSIGGTTDAKSGSMMVCVHVTRRYHRLSWATSLFLHSLTKQFFAVLLDLVAEGSFVVGGGGDDFGGLVLSRLIVVAKCGCSPYLFPQTKDHGRWIVRCVMRVEISVGVHTALADGSQGFGETILP